MPAHFDNPLLAHVSGFRTAQDNLSYEITTEEIRGKIPHDLSGIFLRAGPARNELAGKPFGFSEVAWPSLAPFGGEAAQADFLTRLVGPLSRDAGVDLHLVGWPWLTDLDANDDTGLIEHDGTEKQAYGVWQGL